MDKPPNQPESSDSQEREQSWRIVLGAGIVLLVSILAHIGVDSLLADLPADVVARLPAWLHGLLDRLIDCAIVFAITAMLLETRIFKNYLEIRLARLIQRNQRTLEDHCTTLVKNDFIERALDINYLRQYDSVFLDQAEEMMRRASFAPNLPAEVETFHRALRHVRDQLDVWRTEVRESVYVEEFAGDPGLCVLISEAEWTYVNYNPEERVITQMLSELSYKLAGVNDDDLYHITSLELAGRDVLSSAIVSREAQDGNQVLYKAAFDVRLPPMTNAELEGIRLKYSTRRVRPRTQPLTIRYYRPVYKLRLQLHATRDLHPLVYVFGLRSDGGDNQLDPLEPDQRNKALQFYEWDYDGWFFPSQGVIVTFTEVKNAAQVAPTDKPGVGGSDSGHKETSAS